MNSFCKTFFTLFFTGIITAMLLLSYGLVCSLQGTVEWNISPVAGRHTLVCHPERSEG